LVSTIVDNVMLVVFPSMQGENQGINSCVAMYTNLLRSIYY